jgi:hypothetical protein
MSMTRARLSGARSSRNRAEELARGRVQGETAGGSSRRCEWPSYQLGFALTQLMHWPWFVNDGSSKVRQPPFLQSPSVSGLSPTSKS